MCLCVYSQSKAGQAEVQGLLAQLEEFGTKTVRLGATHRFKRTGSDPGRWARPALSSSTGMHDMHPAQACMTCWNTAWLPLEQ